MQLPKRFLFCLAFFLVTITQPTTLFASSPATWETRFNHVLGIEFQMPSGYELVPEFLHQYTDGKSYVRFWWVAEASPYRNGVSLSDHCARFQWTFSAYTTIREAAPAVCAFSGRDGNNYAVVFPGASHSTSRQQNYNALVIGAPREYLLPIAESIRFVSGVAPSAYLDEALRMIAVNYVYRDSVDWPQLYDQARSTVQADSTLADVHKTLLWVFEQLANAGVGSHRGALLIQTQNQTSTWATGFLTRDFGQSSYPIIDVIYPNSPAATAGLRVGDIIEQVNGVDAAQVGRGAFGTGSMVQLNVRRGGEARTLSLSPQPFDSYLPSIGQWFAGNIGYLETFTLDTSSPMPIASAYAAQTQDLIRQIDQKPVCGWIIDVRRNRGGQIAGMSAALAPLIGDGTWLTDRLADGTIVQGGYQQGSWQSITGGQVVNSQTMLTQPYYLRHEPVPIALLVSSETTSMGEITAFLFQQRPQGKTRVFGEPSQGYLSDGIIDFTLFDGAIIRIVDRVLLDQAGQPAPHHIEPDVYIETDYTVYGTEADPVIQAAIRWLQSQAECAGIRQFAGYSSGAEAAYP